MQVIMEPDWVQKVEEGRENEIAATLSKKDQEKLVIADYLWYGIINTPGWFPVQDRFFIIKKVPACH
ncbi:hypothetical protein V1502_10155 [Bacillus sp. SCS-153A]|uniref:hypothetical protein n=1 Tax=Rossellomorea sedimentorum TaxID=3115294 RepID=UPI003906A58A